MFSFRVSRIAYCINGNRYKVVGPRAGLLSAVEIEIRFEVDTFAVKMAIFLRDKCGESNCGRGD
ncbi:hypothetical protein LCM4579_06460 [Ensifer sp. LCM 4579]|nr:hypothetical protein LCM4579_06460 [Ensifer sp. LCM 4579]